MTTTSRSKFFPWSSKGSRQPPSQEPYYRTGGLLSIDLLPIDTSVGDGSRKGLDDAKHRNAKNLSIVPPDYITTQNPYPGYQNEAQIKSAPNLLTVFTDGFPSSGLSPSAYQKASDIKFSALRSKYSLPPSPALPAELPGSILLHNQGFPTTPSLDAESIADSTVSPSTVMSVRSKYSLSSTAAKPSLAKVPQHKKSGNDLGLQRRSRSRPSLIASPSSTDSKITTCSVSSNGDHASSADSIRARVGPETLLEPAQIIVEGEPWTSKPQSDANSVGALRSSTTRNKQLDELKATITAQDQTISTLQSQFANLRVSHEAHISSLANSHALEISALKDYTKSLESQQRGLHHASSNHLLFLLDTTEPQSPKQDAPHSSAGSTPAGSIRSFKTGLEPTPRSPLRSRNNPEMENLKRKLSMAKRPETGNGDAVRELNLYKQNNEALQKQVESLMAKLNQSKEEERKKKQTLEEIQKTCEDWQKKASKAEQLEKSTLALQNTIDHLEHRLEIANIEKVDAEEQLLNIQFHRSPFDPKPPKLQIASPIDNRQSTRTSMSTVFANESPISPSGNEPATLAAFVTHIERLQEQVRQKDARAAELETENEQLRTKYGRLKSEHRELDLQTDIQGQLLTKAKQNEIHIEELRTAIIKRETMIGEKSKALQQAERQLEHHKLLLEAEIRRHAAFTLFTDARGEPLPELTSLASKGDIDRWIERLQKQLKKDKEEKTGGRTGLGYQGTLENLRREIDFYVREIIYYKLDCRGYKSDIKKLKKMAAQMGAHGSHPGEVESPDPSFCKSVDTPKLLSAMSGAGTSPTPSSVSTGPISVTIPLTQRLTPPPSVITPVASPAEIVKPSAKRAVKHFEIKLPMTPPPRADDNAANEADNIDPGISPRSVAKLSTERRKPTPPSPDQERFGELATNFPLSTPAAPKRHYRRSLSDPLIQFDPRPRTPEDFLDFTQPIRDIKTPAPRLRSGSMPEPPRHKGTPERPPRPRFGLFESEAKNITPLRLQAPPKMDVMAEAMRSSLEQVNNMRPIVARKPVGSSASGTASSFAPSSVAALSNGTAGSTFPAPLQFRSREGSASSGTIVPQPPSTPSRRPSTSSSSNIPFVIAMGSPHNPALISAVPAVPPTVCSITGKLKLVSPSLRIGVGGTMASTTPVTSPTSPTDASKHTYFNTSLPSSKPSSKPPSRNASVSSKDNDAGAGFAAPTAASRSRTTTPNHSRNVSASSIRQAINLPARIDFMKGKGKSRKDSISHPTPLASPFAIDRSTSGKWGKGIGEAI